MTSMPWWRLLTLLSFVVLQSACSPSHLVLNRMADELASQGQAQEDDLVLAREASAFYLKLSESILRQTPDHVALGEAVAGGFTQYAFAFVAFEAERLETQDAKAAQRLRERARRLYFRAHHHAMATLEQRQPGFAKDLASGALQRLDGDQVGLAYWAAASWGGFISLSKDQPDVVADLPLAVRLARLAWAREPGHGQGALASLMGSFEASRPGGQRQEAARFFDQAEAFGGGRNAGVFVARAEALTDGDRPAFERLLHQALAASAARPDLGNQLMRERAQWLLDTADDRF
jgi:predicted anti-sigma-YlaC factor YlaD